MKYIEHIQKGMDLLAANPKSLFIGQATKYKGHAITHQLKNYSDSQLIELPVAEEFQAGFCLGMALEGYVPISIYPRNNFAILAANQIVNHIDKWNEMCPNSTKPKVIIKMAVGSTKPLDPGHQHKANYYEAFDSMCDYISVYNLTETSIGLQNNGYNYIDYVYEQARHAEESCIIVESSQLYQDG